MPFPDESIDREAKLPLIVTLHQINTTVGDFDGNLEKIIRGARAALEKGATLAVFPELSLTGYPPLDLLENRTFVLDAGRALKKLLTESKSLDIAILLGSILPRDENSVGKTLHNSAILVSRGEILREVWGLHPQTRTRVVDTFILRLRKLIEPDPSHPRYLLSVRAFGYRLVEEPESV